MPSALGRGDVYQIALRQLCKIEGRNIADPLEAEFATVMPPALTRLVTLSAREARRHGSSRW
jgi:hypothetical protein